MITCLSWGTSVGSCKDCTGFGTLDCSSPSPDFRNRRLFGGWRGGSLEKTVSVSAGQHWWIGRCGGSLGPLPDPLSLSQSPLQTTLVGLSQTSPRDEMSGLHTFRTRFLLIFRVWAMEFPNNLRASIA